MQDDQKSKKSLVCFTSFRSNPKNKFINRLKNILQMLNVKDLSKKRGIVGIKTHFGEKGCTTFIQPVYIRQIIDLLKPYDWKLFVTDTNTIYLGERANSVDHMNLAIQHGFTLSSLGAPVIISDGVRGNAFKEVEIENGQFYKKVKVAWDIAHCNALVVVSHVKGHMLSGFGGALKNLGMGCAPRTHKYSMHANLTPVVKKDKCIGCGECVNWCPGEAIKVIDTKAKIDAKLCIGCGECIGACPERAINLPWDESAANVQRKYVETARGVMKALGQKIFFINFINNVTPDCDCMSHSDASLVPDIGVAFSFDPVALDKASVDLVNQSEGIRGSSLSKNFAAGEDKFKDVFPHLDWNVQLEHAVKLGLGSKNYELKVIE
ncbi:MAG: DUF362 domain-containing protein [Spirochaetes bacterium]|nr:DUF362 domain-containing protein [Spirochaetota bacterium]